LLFSILIVSLFSNFIISSHFQIVLDKVEKFLEQALGWNDSFAVAIAVGCEGENGRELYERVLKLASTILSRERCDLDPNHH
jgi:hypothetical protein